MAERGADGDGDRVFFRPECNSGNLRPVAPLCKEGQRERLQSAMTSSRERACQQKQRATASGGH